MSKNKPLLSEEIVNDVVATSQTKEEVGRRLSSWFQSKHDLDQHKDRELIQTLTNSIAFFLNHGLYVDKEMAMFYANGGKSLSAALALAGEQGYQPTEK